jgi:UDP-galactopyranose mutase
VERADVVVVGGGISGAAFAFHAGRPAAPEHTRRSVIVIEAEAEVGGALATVREPSGFWYELGAHTLYSSYGATLAAAEAAGLLGTLQARGKPVLRFLEADGRVGRGKNLGALLARCSKLELLRALPRWLGAHPAGRTVAEHYGRLVGARNYARVLGPMLSAVPSQIADEIPADMLFKRRERRRDVPRSFTFQGGARSLVEGLLAASGAAVKRGRRALALAVDGAGYRVTLDDGETIAAGIAALAVPPATAAVLLRGAGFSAAAAAAGRVGQVEVESLGVSVPRDAVALDYATFLIPLSGPLRSVVTRDVVPDAERRGFAFHFAPGPSRAERVELAARILGLPRQRLGDVHERRGVLPAPRRGHAAVVAELDRALAGTRLAVTGNWFGGLAIEDCVLRSRAEWRRVGEV